jgi:hypothetical protein
VCGACIVYSTSACSRAQQSVSLAVAAVQTFETYAVLVSQFYTVSSAGVSVLRAAQQQCIYI